MQRKFNPVHSYVEGDSFKNIFGGVTPSKYGQIIHIEYLTPKMVAQWPWMRDKWALHSNSHPIGWYGTLDEAKAAAEEKWPGCWFKTPAQYRDELVLTENG